jgi:phthalate 4,5-dioxygenase
MGPIQNHAKEKLLPTDRAIVMARRMLYEAAVAMRDGAEPPALGANDQRIRAAGVLLDRGVKPQDWAKTRLTGGLHQPVYSI